MQLEPLLTGNELHPVDAGVEIARPEARPAQHHREGRQQLDRFFVDERQLIGVERIVPKPETERVQDRVFLAVGLHDLRNVERAKPVVNDGHLFAQYQSMSSPRRRGPILSPRSSRWSAGTQTLTPDPTRTRRRNARAASTTPQT